MRDECCHRAPVPFKECQLLTLRKDQLFECSDGDFFPRLNICTYRSIHGHLRVYHVRHRIISTTPAAHAATCCDRFHATPGRAMSLHVHGRAIGLRFTYCAYSSSGRGARTTLGIDPTCASPKVPWSSRP